MNETTCRQWIQLEGETLVERLKELIHEANVRRVVVQHQGRTVAEFSLTAGVVGTLIAPVAAAVGTLVALLEDCTIQVEREPTTSDTVDKASATTSSTRPGGP